ncbi:MAG: ASCH domain-containing protein [Elusimicrobia bacterium]|nr:ASCH domain-containing protein [Elusimicrobiota bacterium]
MTEKFQIGWFGDGGLGERMIQLILSGRKTSTTCPSYDTWDANAKIGDTLELIDKHGRVHGTIVIMKIETRRWDAFDESLASAEGMTLAELSERLRLANAHDIRPDEEMRVVHFRLQRKLDLKPRPR